MDLTTNVMSEVLVEAIKSAALDLQNGCSYDWNDLTKDNVAFVVRRLLNMSDSELAKKMARYQSVAYTWSSLYRYKSPLPIFRAMKDNGLTDEMVESIEYLSDAEVLDNANFDESPDYTYREHVIRYLLSMAEVMSGERV